MVPKKELSRRSQDHGDVIEDRKTGKQATITQMFDTDAVMDYNPSSSGQTAPRYPDHFEVE